MLDQGRYVVSHRLEAQEAVYVGRAPMGLQIYSNDLPAFCEQPQDLPEHLDRADATMQQDKRPAGAVDLVIHLETVHGSVSARPSGRDAVTAGHGVAPPSWLESSGRSLRR